MGKLRPFHDLLWTAHGFKTRSFPAVEEISQALPLRVHLVLDKFNSLDYFVKGHFDPDEVHDALVHLVDLPGLGLQQIPHLGEFQDHQAGNGGGFHLFGFPHHGDAAFQEAFQGEVEEGEKHEDDRGAEQEGGAAQ